MKTPLATRVFLAIAGFIGFAIGGALLFVPAEFQATAGIVLGDDVNLLSDTRAAGGTLFVAGLVIALGVFTPRMVHTSLVLSGLIYLSYGASRVLGLMLDGMPQSSLVAAMVVEIIIGVMGLVLLRAWHKSQMKSPLINP